MYTAVYNNSMKTSDRDKAVLLILQYLQKNTWPDHGVSAASILAYLSENGIETDRRTVYTEINTLKACGYPIHMIHKNRSYTYMIERPFSLSETFLLMDAIYHSAILSSARKEDLAARLSTFLAEGQRQNMPVLARTDLLSGNEHVPEAIDLLLEAIMHNRMVSFSYFDFTPAKKKAYRRGGRPYVLQPVSILSSQNRYYCVFYSFHHEGFANYRIDKMDHLALKEEGKPVPPFDPDSYMKKNFNMYRGDDRAITMIVDNDLASVFFDTFGMDVLIEEVNEKTFTALIRRPLVPTLEGWVFQFCDKVRVTEPAELRQKLEQRAGILLAGLHTKGESSHGK